MVTAASYTWLIILDKCLFFFLTLSDPGRCDPGFWNMDFG